jgi:hypothetical protein
MDPMKSVNLRVVFTGQTSEEDVNLKPPFLLENALKVIIKGSNVLNPIIGFRTL